MNYSILEVDDDKIIDHDIQPIHLSKPANIKNGDQVYVIQHPRGSSLAFYSSESIVESECMYVHMYMCIYFMCVFVCVLVCSHVYVCVSMLIAVLRDSVVNFSGPYLYYQCTAEKGSLGSPVLKEVDGELKIAALHQGTKVGDLSGYKRGTLMQEIYLEEEGRSHSHPPIN